MSPQSKLDVMPRFWFPQASLLSKAQRSGEVITVIYPTRVGGINPGDLAGSEPGGFLLKIEFCQVYSLWEVPEEYVKEVGFVDHASFVSFLQVFHSGEEVSVVKFKVIAQKGV